MSTIQHFLLVFDHRKDALISHQSFGSDLVAATDAYSRCERQFEDDHAIDIVLVGSDSLETVKITHANYFEGMSKQLMNRAMNISF